MRAIEKFIGKRKVSRGIKKRDMEEFVKRKIEENLRLDYKHIDKFNNPDDLSASISAFANSAGGLLILGVSEETKKDKRGRTLRVFPKSITWGSKDLSRERLEQRLVGRIQPYIEGLKIFTVRKSKRDPKVIFLIDIPQSENPPHQAADKKYYQRLNFIRMPMEDYQIRDLFGKRRKPRLDVKLSRVGKKDEDGFHKFRIYIVNSGKGVAKYTSVIMRFPEEETHIEDLKASRMMQRVDELYANKKALQFRENVDIIHPGTNLNIGNIEVKFKPRKRRLILSYTARAEDMETRSNTVRG